MIKIIKKKTDAKRERIIERGKRGTDIKEYLLLDVVKYWIICVLNQKESAWLFLREESDQVHVSN